MADTLDVLTLDEAKRAVSLSESRVGNEDVLEMAVTAVSRVIDDLRGPVVIREVAGEVHVGGWRSIIPRVQPVAAITAITEYSGTTPQTLVVEDFPSTTPFDYRLDEDGIVHRHASGEPARFASNRVVVTYEAGRYPDTESVDAQFKKAASEVLFGNWQKFAAAWARGGDPFADPVFFDEVTNALNRWVPLSDREPRIAG
jgi:hypothetical protein